MEEEQPQQQIQQSNKYLDFIKSNNKYSLYFIGAIVILLIIIISITVIISNNALQKTTVTPTVTSIPNVSQIPSSSPSTSGSSPSISSAPIMTPNPTQATVIENQIQPQVNQQSAVQNTITNITQFGDNWATVSLNNTDVGVSGVIIEKVNGAWKVVYGPASLFPTQDLESIGAPQSLIDNLHPPVSASPSTEPSQ